MSRSRPSADAALRRLRWGRSPGRRLTVLRPPGAPGELVELGRLVRIELSDGGLVVPRGPPVWVVTSAALDDLWLVAAGGIESRAPDGFITAITYAGAKGEVDAWWRHAFWHPLPRLIDGQIVRGESRYTLNEHGIVR
ncbi:MAG: hypothetical protein R3F65_30910 [bacterium]